MVNSNTSAVRAGSQRRVTLRMIAAAAGVSVMTVSRALREDTSVSPKLRARLRRMAGRLGYRPDPNLSALCAYCRRIRLPAEHGVIGYLTTHASRGGFRANVASRAEKRGQALGIGVDGGG